MGQRGKVYLVGAGPGDPGLLTWKGRDVLARAQVGVHDRLVSQAILDLIPPEARRIDVGKNAGHHPVPQGEINQILVREALAGHRVVRLKGGDSFLFGRGGEELEQLARLDIPFEVVPGITSALAAPAYAGIPVTHRDYCSSLHIITGHKKADGQLELDYGALVRLQGTLVFLMSVGSLGQIAQGLLAAGMSPDMPCALVENGTLPQQRSFSATLDTVAQVARDQEVRSPAVFLVGRVASLARQFHWFDRLPLKGKRLLVTRPREESSALALRLQELGAQVDRLPAIRLEGLDFQLPPLDSFDVVALTSATGVRYFLEGLLARGLDARALGGKRLAAVGNQTAAALSRFGLRADFVPTEYNGAAMARQMVEQGFLCPQDRVLVARAQSASPGLTDGLRQLGVAFCEIATYRTALTEERLADPSLYDAVLFTSASTVEGFARACPGADLSQVKALCIGPQTAQRAQALSMQTQVAPQATIQSMIETLMGGNEPC